MKNIIDEVLLLYVSREDHNPKYRIPFLRHPYIYATNGHILIRVNENIVQTKYDGSKLNPESMFGLSNCDHIITIDELKTLVSSPDIGMMDETTTTGKNIVCKECNGDGVVEWEYGRWSEDFDCPACGGSGYEESEKEVPTGNKIPDPCHPINLHNTHFRFMYIQMLIKTMQSLGLSEIRLVRQEPDKGNLFVINEDIQVIIMPVLP